MQCDNSYQVMILTLVKLKTNIDVIVMEEVVVLPCL